MARPTRYSVRRSLLAQMKSKGMAGSHFRDLAEDYMALYDRKQELLADLEERGTVCHTTDSKGNPVTNTNPSLAGLLKVNKTMADILKSLDLNEPDGVTDDDEL